MDSDDNQIISFDGQIIWDFELETKMDRLFDVGTCLHLSLFLFDFLYGEK